MKQTLTALIALATLGMGTAALAQTAPATEAPAVDPAAVARGAEAFSQCQSCHVVRNDAGEVLAGRNGRTGPNLFGVIGRVAGSYPDFRYGDGIVAAGQGGLVWDEASFVAYVQDPTGFLRETTGNNRARGNMSFRVRNEAQAHDLYAFLSTFSTPPAAGN